MKLPLVGVTVLEFADYVTGPYAASLLADLGARVIKVEAPNRGDPFRGWEQGSYTPTFASVNRNKESVTLDLRTSQGRAVARRLAKACDVFVENHRPGVADRAGLGYEHLHELAPKVVYCSISGFGNSGPYRDRPGYDTIGQATGGLLSLLTDWHDPKGMGISLSDHLAGLFAAYGILGALIEVQRTGVGQQVETSLLQATVAFVGESAARYFESGVVPDRKHRTVIAQVYAFVAGDGLPFVIHLSSPQKFFAGLATAIDRPELVRDERFADRRARIEHYDELNELLREVFGQDERAVWLSRLAERDVPAAPINTLAEVFNDPQVRHLGIVQEVAQPGSGPKRLVGGAIRLAGHDGSSAGRAPLLGQHTDSILREVGYDEGDISQLKRVGVV